MKYGLIDIGSNTMRAVVYDVIQDDFEVLINEKEFAEILSYVDDNYLAAEGIDRLCFVLKRMKALCEQIECDEFSCFATASLRGLDNQKEVLAAVKDRVGLDICLIDGCTESYYDYIGLKSAIEVPTACGFDLGGGSGQVFYYKENRLAQSYSYPIGTLAMYNKFVKGLFPNSKERTKIVKYVNKHLSSGVDFKEFGEKTLYGMGGTARALAKVHKHLLGRDEKVQDYRITYQELGEIDSMLTGFGLGGIKLLNRIIPERLVTFYPGLITIMQFMLYTGADNLTIIDYGVREGYLIENAINKGRGMNAFARSKEYLCQ